MRESIRSCALAEQREQVLELLLKLALNSPDVGLCFHVDICSSKTMKTPMAKSPFIKRKSSNICCGQRFLAEEVQQQKCLWLGR